MHSISVLANTMWMQSFLAILKILFAVLLSPSKTEILGISVNYLKNKIEKKNVNDDTVVAK